MKYSRALSSVNVSSVGSWVTTGLEGEGESEGEKGREAGSKEKGRKEGRKGGREEEEEEASGGFIAPCGTQQLNN